MAGVPMPESFIASRSSASSMSLPAVSIAPSSEASVKRRGGCVSLRSDSTERVSTSSPCSSFGSSWSPPESSSAAPAVGLLAVDGLPARLDQHAGRSCGRRARRRWSRRACARRPPRGGRWPGSAWRRGRRPSARPAPIFAEVVLGPGRDDRVVVLDLLVVDHAPERQLVERRSRTRRPCAYCALWPDELGGRLDLGDHVAGQEARVRARVGDRLVLLVELLGRRQRAPRREAEERVRVALERGEVVEELRLLALLLLLELRDRRRAGRCVSSTIAVASSSLAAACRPGSGPRRGARRSAAKRASTSQ